MTPSITPMTSGSATGNTPASTSNLPTAPVTENMFLQLLVAQLQNQDPTNPADSTQFVTQLAQFQTMEQSMSQGQDISAMHTDLDTIVADLTASNATASK
jgi:flagellar basal-body rod modification protein FlgD